MANHNQVIVELAKRYPKCFVAEKWIKHHPISTSVHVELVVEGITLPENELATILRRYVRSIEYLKAMKPGTV